MKFTKRLWSASAVKKLLGGILIGDADSYGALLQLALNDLDLPENPDDLILPQREGGGSTLLGVDALPDSAQICSCNNVTKGDLCTKINNGVTELGELKSCTKAGTSCGGCAALVKQLLESELEKQGIEVKKDICEHFAYSRQELYHIIRVEGIHTFDELLEMHGKGHGCDICKPTAASILASCWNDYILKEPLAALQDTNDYYLANMQKMAPTPLFPGYRVERSPLTN